MREWEGIILSCQRSFILYIHITYHNYCTGGLLLGWFEPEAKPAFESSPVPSKDWMKNIKNNTAHWQPLWDKVLHRLPILEEVKQPNIYNCPDNFTPDGRWILGESPEVKNYYVAVGMNGNSLQGKLKSFSILSLCSILLHLYLNTILILISFSKRCWWHR